MTKKTLRSCSKTMVGKYRVSLAVDRTWNGRVFASKAEMRAAKEFEALKKAGEIFELEYQPVIELLPRPNLVKYIPDFKITWRNGTEELIDIKGVSTEVFKLKIKMLRHFYPNKKLSLIPAKNYY